MDPKDYTPVEVITEKGNVPFLIPTESMEKFKAMGIDFIEPAKQKDKDED